MVRESFARFQAAPVEFPVNLPLERLIRNRADTVRRLVILQGSPQELTQLAAPALLQGLPVGDFYFARPDRRTEAERNKLLRDLADGRPLPGDAIYLFKSPKLAEHSGLPCLRARRAAVRGHPGTAVNAAGGRGAGRRRVNLRLLRLRCRRNRRLVRRELRILRLFRPRGPLPALLPGKRGFPLNRRRLEPSPLSSGTGAKAARAAVPPPQAAAAARPSARSTASG